MSNGLNFRCFGRYLRLVELLNETDKLIVEKFTETTFDVSFLSLDKEDLLSLVSRCDLQVKREEHIFDAVAQWVNHDYKRRSQYICELLQQVKLPLI